MKWCLWTESSAWYQTRPLQQLSCRSLGEIEWVHEPHPFPRGRIKLMPSGHLWRTGEISPPGLPHSSPAGGKELAFLKVLPNLRP